MCKLKRAKNGWLSSWLMLQITKPFQTEPFLLIRSHPLEPHVVSFTLISSLSTSINNTQNYHSSFQSLPILLSPGLFWTLTSLLDAGHSLYLLPILHPIIVTNVSQDIILSTLSTTKLNNANPVITDAKPVSIPLLVSLALKIQCWIKQLECVNFHNISKPWEISKLLQENLLMLEHFLGLKSLKVKEEKFNYLNLYKIRRHSKCIWHCYTLKVSVIQVNTYKFSSTTKNTDWTHPIFLWMHQLK